MSAKRLYLACCLIPFAIASAAWAISPWLMVCINLTGSLPGTLFVVIKGAAVHPGDLVAFYWRGGASYPAGALFIKQVIGGPGEVVWRQDQTYWVGAQRVGLAKSHSRAGIALTPAPTGVIGANEWFVATPSADSLDSRYAVSGNVRREQVVGKAYAVF